MQSLWPSPRLRLSSSTNFSVSADRIPAARRDRTDLTVSLTAEWPSIFITSRVTWSSSPHPGYFPVSSHTARSIPPLPLPSPPPAQVWDFSDFCKHSRSLSGKPNIVYPPAYAFPDNFFSVAYAAIKREKPSGITFFFPLLWSGGRKEFWEGRRRSSLFLRLGWEILSFQLSSIVYSPSMKNRPQLLISYNPFQYRRRKGICTGTLFILSRDQEAFHSTPLHIPKWTLAESSLGWHHQVAKRRSSQTSTGCCRCGPTSAPGLLSSELVFRQEEQVQIHLAAPYQGQLPPPVTASWASVRGTDWVSAVLHEWGPHFGRGQRVLVADCLCRPCRPCPSLVYAKYVGLVCHIWLLYCVCRWAMVQPKP